MELFSPGHLLVLALVILVLFFGWKQLPDMARSLGRSLRIFKTEIKGMSEDDKKRSEAQIVEQPKSIEASVKAGTATSVETSPAAPRVTPGAAAPRPRPTPAGAARPTPPQTSAGE